MNQTGQTSLQHASEDVNIRGIIALPAIGDFYNELMDRLHMVLDQFFLEEKFTIFINALPRDHMVGTKIYMDRFEFAYISPEEIKGKRVHLIYGGTTRQREFLEGSEENLIKDLKKYWEILEKTKALSEKETKISFALYEEFRSRDFSLSDIEEKCTGKLADYFESKLHPELGLPPLTKEQEAEYEILNHHFAVNTYRYLSLPLIQFAEFDGVVHIILSEDDYQSNFIDKDGKLSSRVVGNAIKAFSREYEGLILDWDIVGDAKLKETSFMDALDFQKFYSEHNNPILIELGYQKYYEKHLTYFEDRFRYNKQVPLDIRQQYRQVAIIHVLIDSYAHNISAHSLTALEWWFRQRADLQHTKKLGESVARLESQKSNLVALLRDYEMQLDKEIHPLLRFLLDKGAFWTGLTRDNSFGGRIMNLHNVLWRDFINNPLYLGTIAFTEGIVKVHINITFLKYLSHEGHMRVKKKVEFDGHYATVDLQHVHSHDIQDTHNHISSFVEKGANFEELKNLLLKYEGFFPGGIVGEHAFFTILETELRNVKHYKPHELQKIKENGLTLNISIEEDNYRDASERINIDEKHYYKIGVWLKHPLHISKDLMKLRPKKLYSDIIDVGTSKYKEEDEEDKEATFLPKLGGTYQDKVCAAMLFNNTFASVEDQETKRDKRFYPWLKGGSSPNIEYKVGEEIEDIEISARRLFNKEFGDSRDYFEKNIHPHDGYFKKFFFIWKGENIYSVEKDKENELDTVWENVSRFRFVQIPVGNTKLFQQVREMGIVRIVNNTKTDTAEAYREWLIKWLKPDQLPYRIEFVQDSNLNGQLELGTDILEFRNSTTLDEQFVDNTQEINLIHNPDQADSGGKAAVRYRNHGIFKQYFCDGKNVPEVDMGGIKAANLFEVLATRICVFDNRIFGRFRGVNMDILTQQLHCTIYGEDQDIWQKEKQLGFNRYHFLVVHLSFIEAFKDEQGTKKYNEENIRSFIDKEILQDSKAPQNFMLVITTGRGRTHWWERLRSEQQSAKPGENVPPYTSFVTFRPVESLTAAIEHAITMNDDIELKYRLVKVLFGS